MVSTNQKVASLSSLVLLGSRYEQVTNTLAKTNEDGLNSFTFHI